MYNVKIGNKKYKKINGESICMLITPFCLLWGFLFVVLSNRILHTTFEQSDGLFFLLIPMILSFITCKIDFILMDRTTAKKHSDLKFLDKRYEKLVNEHYDRMVANKLIYNTNYANVELFPYVVIYKFLNITFYRVISSEDRIKYCVKHWENHLSDKGWVWSKLGNKGAYLQMDRKS